MCSTSQFVVWNESFLSKSCTRKALRAHPPHARSSRAQPIEYSLRILDCSDLHSDHKYQTDHGDFLFMGHRMKRCHCRGNISKSEEQRWSQPAPNGKGRCSHQHSGRSINMPFCIILIFLHAVSLWWRRANICIWKWLLITFLRNVF